MPSQIEQLAAMPKTNDYVCILFFRFSFSHIFFFVLDWEQSVGTNDGPALRPNGDSFIAFINSCQFTAVSLSCFFFLFVLVNICCFDQETDSIGSSNKKKKKKRVLPKK